MTDKSTASDEENDSSEHSIDSVELDESMGALLNQLGRAPTVPIPEGVPEQIIGSTVNASLHLHRGDGEVVLASWPESGDLLGERFELVDILGSGAFGRVFRARDRVLKRDVAAKVIWQGSSNPNDASEVFREAVATGWLRHPHIVTIHDCGVQGPWRYLILELLVGETLQSRLDRVGVLKASEAVSIVTQVTEVLLHAHSQGVLHRDLKPDNIFIEQANHVKVLDLGLALIDTDRLSVASAIEATPLRSGTPPYMAPEQWSGQVQSARTDVWAIGAVLYQLLTGRFPYPGPDYARSGEKSTPIRTYTPALSAELERIVAKTLEPEPEARFQSSADLLAALSGLSESADQPKLKKPQRWMWSAGLLVALCAGAGVWWASTSRSFERPMVHVPAGVMPEVGKTTHSERRIALCADASPEGDCAPFVLYANQNLRPSGSVAAFFIDRHEVSNRDYTACVASNACTAPDLARCQDLSLTGSFKPGQEISVATLSQPEYPVVCVDMHDARTFCSWAGKRLPSDKEWMFVATRGGHNGFPWGAKLDPARANGADLALNRAMGWAEDVILRAPNDDGFGRTAPVTSYAKGATAGGVLHMSGNVWEWTEGKVSHRSETYFTSHGGSWSSAGPWLEGYNIHPRLENMRRTDLGFRCARGIKDNPKQQP